MIRAALSSLDELRALKLAELADLRWEKDTGGTTFDGMTFATDAVSQTEYIGAVVAHRLTQMTDPWKDTTAAIGSSGPPGSVGSARITLGRGDAMDIPWYDHSDVFAGGSAPRPISPASATAASPAPARNAAAGP